MTFRLQDVEEAGQASSEAHVLRADGPQVLIGLAEIEKRRQGEERRNRIEDDLIRQSVEHFERAMGWVVAGVG